jgi:hypothetical protein
MKKTKIMEKRLQLKKKNLYTSNGNKLMVPMPFFITEVHFFL